MKVKKRTDRQLLTLYRRAIGTDLAPPKYVSDRDCQDSLREIRYVLALKSDRAAEKYLLRCGWGDAGWCAQRLRRAAGSTAK